MEMAIYNRMENFCLKYKLINEDQYGFQKKSGTLAATTKVINYIQNNLDRNSKMKSGCIFIDLKKAFDTVPHDTLMDKLYKYGFRGKMHSLLASYIKNRKTYVDINGTHSEIITNNFQFSIGQGSNLAPLLFLLYINDAFNLKLHGKLILFADDAIIIYAETEFGRLRDKMQEDLEKLSKWCIINKLTMNTKKTKCMLIFNNKTPPEDLKLNLRVRNDEIEQVDRYKYLGLIIQNNLKWNLHIQNTISRVSSLCGVLSRLGNRVNVATLKSIYYSKINSLISYLSPIWGPSATQYEINKLQVMQNNAIRRVFSLEYYSNGLSTTQIYKKYNILNIEKTIKYNSTILAFKINKQLIKLNTTINRNNDIHSYGTRNNHAIQLSQFRTHTGRDSVLRVAYQNYNQLALNLNNRNLNQFKKEIKHIIMTTDSNTQ